MKKIYFLLCVFAMLVQTVGAVTKEEADQAYEQNKFPEAIQLYEALLSEQGESPDVYYNLGNAYFKDKNTAKAVLNYERALLLNPGDTDTRYNLEVARSKSVDQITPASEVFFVTWYRSVAETMSEKQWSSVAISSFVLLLICLGLYFLGKQMLVRKIGFIAAVVLLLVTLIVNSFASTQCEKLINRNGAIVMAPSVTVKSTPSESGTDLFVLHEGTKVFVEDDSMKEWKEIRLEDGNKGWISTDAIEKI